jgi:hypothetical protein
MKGQNVNSVQTDKWKVRGQSRIVILSDVEPEREEEHVQIKFN